MVYQIFFKIAITKKYDDLIRFFIHNGANICINNHTAITMACKYNKSNLVKFLLEKGANFYGANNAPF